MHLEGMGHLILQYLKRVPAYFWLGVAAVLLAFFLYELHRRKTVGKTWKACGADLILAAYFMLVAVAAFGTRLPDMKAEAELMPFRSYMAAAKGNRMELFMIMGNVAIFLPFGFFLPVWLRIERGRHCGWGRAALCGFCLSLTVETVQLITHYGCFESDDIINNVLGTVMGYAIWRMARKGKEICSKRSNGKKTES